MPDVIDREFANCRAPAGSERSPGIRRGGSGVTPFAEPSAHSLGDVGPAAGDLTGIVWHGAAMPFDQPFFAGTRQHRILDDRKIAAPLQIAFYQAGAFPAEYHGSAFVTLHGSWNRGQRTGYKVVRLPFKDGKATGEYEDFMTGYVVSDKQVWGRPVGIAVAKDGSLIVTEDGSGTIWRGASSISGRAGLPGRRHGPAKPTKCWRGPRTSTWYSVTTI
jgi:hypothetical protein